MHQPVLHRLRARPDHPLTGRTSPDERRRVPRRRRTPPRQGPEPLPGHHPYDFRKAEILAQLAVSAATSEATETRTAPQPTDA
ncbi:hypothetical protein ACN24M_16330 [Streptomyces microflavus]